MSINEMINELYQIIFNIDQFIYSFDNVFLAVGIVCALVFLETGLVVTPFLPGDSMLFVTGTLVAARIPEAIIPVCLVIAAAGILGNTSNYAIGRYAGQKLLASRYTLIKPSHLAKTEEFYDKYGSKTLIIARFIPIVRTIAPFMAGMGRMRYNTFFTFNIVGALLWVFLLTIGGFFLGKVPVVRNNLTLVMIGIIVLSLLPGLIAFIVARFRLLQDAELQ